MSDSDKKSDTDSARPKSKPKGPPKEYAAGAASRRSRRASEDMFGKVLSNLSAQVWADRMPSSSSAYKAGQRDQDKQDDPTIPMAKGGSVGRSVLGYRAARHN
jgi:hypothetical protein|tara:strand:- start:592 stop:900 length:309 start_codon:yes stop_codon:yes gene_type:complete